MCRHSTKLKGFRNAIRNAFALARPGNPRICARPRKVGIASITALILAAFLPLSNQINSAGQSPTEYQVKAAFLFNFLKFVEWPDDGPADSHAKWVIGFVGDSPISDELTRLAGGKNVMGRELEVKKFQDADSQRGCNILFISTSEKKRLPNILEGLRGANVLTVGDMDHFVGSGGMVQFVVEEDRVRLAIDVSATSHARLKISSKLLSLARVVAGAERE